MHPTEVEKQDAASALSTLHIALVGNPNCGKSSLFNYLTGLRQKVGNFPGVTVDKKEGSFKLESGEEVVIWDFPGCYSLYPNAQDERIVCQTLTNPNDINFPDVVIYVADVTKLEKHLLLFTQVCDLGIPMILALNMADIAEQSGLQIDTQKLNKEFDVPIVTLSGRTGQGLDTLKQAIAILSKQVKSKRKPFYKISDPEQEAIKEVKQCLPIQNNYQALLIAHHYKWLPFLVAEEKAAISTQLEKKNFEDLKWQVEETMQRFDRFEPLVKKVRLAEGMETGGLTQKLDQVLTHRVAGPLIFLLIMVLVFQSIYAWAAYPMDLIEGAFGAIGTWIQAILPESWFTSLLTDGIIAGLGGIMVFIPQIAILFFLITLLEEVGYMARAAYMFDRVMQFFGLNGRSLVALISSGACAIPAIMSTRTIGNWKERLITIMVSPLISCSARIPVYIVLIGFAVPATNWGIFNLQGLAFMGLYLLGIVAALLSAIVFKWILKTNERSFLMLELPEYRSPVLRNVGLSVWEKVKTFIVEAGKIIFVISIILWFLASYGPGQQLQLAEQEALTIAQEQQLDERQTENLIAAKQIEASYAGLMGKCIEPLIQPLGFDWKIGIALITSFAAREVFVGTMATIYSIGSEEDEYSVRDRLALEKDPVTGEMVYNQATSISLLFFYVFAMMCMSTLAVVKRETKSWKWPIIQFVFMTGLAYLSSLLIYQWLA